jgi:hypothetical protein
MEERFDDVTPGETPAACRMSAQAAELEWERTLAVAVPRAVRDFGHSSMSLPVNDMSPD